MEPICQLENFYIMQIKYNFSNFSVRFRCISKFLGSSTDACKNHNYSFKICTIFPFQDGKYLKKIGENDFVYPTNVLDLTTEDILMLNENLHILTLHKYYGPIDNDFNMADSNLEMLNHALVFINRLHINKYFTLRYNKGRQALPLKLEYIQKSVLMIPKFRRISYQLQLDAYLRYLYWYILCFEHNIYDIVFIKSMYFPTKKEIIRKPNIFGNDLYLILGFFQHYINCNFGVQLFRNELDFIVEKINIIVN